MHTPVCRHALPSNGKYEQQPAVIYTPNDTGLAKLWAGSNHAFSEVFRRGNLGSVFGFVDPSYSLLALEQDSLGAGVQTAYTDSGVPMLGVDDIYLPEGEQQDPDVTSTMDLGAGQSLRNPGLFLMSANPARQFIIGVNTGNAENAEMVIYDVNGRTVARWSRRALMDKKVVVWYGTGQHQRRLAQGIYFAVLKIDNKVFKQKLILL